MFGVQVLVVIDGCISIEWNIIGHVLATSDIDGIVVCVCFAQV